MYTLCINEIYFPLYSGVY